MKKFLLMIAVLCGTAFSAQAQTPAEVLAGTYTGDLAISLGAPVSDESPVLPDQQVTITADEDGQSVTLSIADFRLGEPDSEPLGDIVLPGVPVSQEADGSIVFGEKEPVSLVLGGMIEATAQINPTTSVFADGVLTADIDVVWTNGGDLPIYVRFIGEQPAVAGGVAEAIAGDYTGNLIISLGAPVNDESPVLPGQQVTLTADEGGQSVTLSITDFRMGEPDSEPLGDIVLPGVPVSQEADGSIVFGEKEPVSLVLGGMIEATAQINPTTSVIRDGILSADIDVVWTNGGNLPIYVRFVSDGTSGIHSAATAPASKAAGIYTLSGRRVSATSTDQLPAGLYIIDGKKTLVK